MRCAYTKQLKSFVALQALQIQLIQLFCCVNMFSNENFHQNKFKCQLPNAINYNNCYSFWFGFQWIRAWIGSMKRLMPNTTTDSHTRRSLCSNRFTCNERMINRDKYFDPLQRSCNYYVSQAIRSEMNMIFLWCHISCSWMSSVKHHFLSCHNSICEQWAHNHFWIHSKWFVKNAPFHLHNFLVFLCVLLYWVNTVNGRLNHFDLIIIVQMMWCTRKVTSREMNCEFFTLKSKIIQFFAIWIVCFGFVWKLILKSVKWQLWFDWYCCRCKRRQLLLKLTERMKMIWNT